MQVFVVILGYLANSCHKCAETTIDLSYVFFIQCSFFGRENWLPFCKCLTCHCIWFIMCFQWI